MGFSIDTLDMILIILIGSLVIQLSHLIGFCRRIDRIPMIETLLATHAKEGFV